MITSPSSAELLRTVRAGLEAGVAPSVVDPAAIAALAQAGLVLRFLEATIDSEALWLREEIADVHATASTLIELGADSDGAIGAALRTSAAAQTACLDLPGVRSEYDRAGEVLSRCLEAGVWAGGEAHEVAAAALRRRVERETAIRAAGGLAYTSRASEGRQG